MTLKLPMVYQTENIECGLAALAMIMQHYGKKVSLSQLRQQYPLSLSGISMGMLQFIAKANNFQASVLRIELSDLGNLHLPVMLHWNLNHFVVLKKIDKNTFTLHDPSKGIIRISLAEVSQKFTGIVLQCYPSENEVEEKISKPYLTLFKIAAFLSIYQILVFLFPRYFQILIDKVIPLNNLHYVFILTAGYCWLKLFSILAKIGKDVCIIKLETNISQLFSSHIGKKLISLPYHYFEARSLSEILNRFNSVEQIRQIFTNGLLEGAWDGVICVVLLAVMLTTNFSLALYGCVLVAIFILVRLIISPSITTANHEMILARSHEQAKLLENIRGIQPIKLFSKEPEMLLQWKNQYTLFLSAVSQLKQLKIYKESLKELFVSVDLILIVFISALKIIHQEMTIGAMYAYIFYRQIFINALFNFLDKLGEVKLLRIHFERLKDITTHVEQCKTTLPLSNNNNFVLQVFNLGFKYSPLEPYLFENVNIDIKRGEVVVLVGASGSGKTTLMKVMMGLLHPTTGGVQLGSQRVASVMQKDSLLNGSIAQNIAFSSHFIEDKVQKCAKLAGIYDEINKMPLKFNTLVGDMGTSLSGGQQQRILLARALYAEPEILFLDEATSHLDVSKEREVNAAIKSLGITCIMIAHREETINMADRKIMI